VVKEIGRNVTGVQGDVSNPGEGLPKVELPGAHFALPIITFESDSRGNRIPTRVSVVNHLIPDPSTMVM
jgi:hypothetical protein